MRLPVLLLALVLALPALAPSLDARELPASGGPLQLWLSSLQAPLGGVGPVEQLLDTAPTKAEDSRRNVTADGVAWYVVPGATRELAITGNVSGTMGFLVELPPGLLPLQVTHIDYTVTFDLRRVTANGTQESVGSAQVPLVISLQPLFPPAPGPITINWTMTPGNASVRAGETLGLNVSATGPSNPAGTSLVGLYDSTNQPSAMSLTLAPVLRGAVQLSAATSSREAAPGSSPTYTLTVRNAGDATDTVRLNTSGDRADWAVRLNPGTVTVPAGGTASALVTVVVPANATDGARHTATIQASSANGGSASLTLTTTVRAGPAATPGDTDGDGWRDVDERRYLSDPNDPNSTPDNTDTDGDGASNRAEIDANTDPQNPRDFPGSGSPGGGPAAAGCSVVPLCDTFVQSFGMDDATADLASIALILLFLVVLLLLVLLLLGSYPVKVSLVAARADTEPGRGVDYTVEVRSRKRQPQVVDLEVAELPGDWDARLSQPRLSLDPRETQTVGLLVRPPDAWPAPSKREFQVRARSRLKPGKFAKAVGKLSIHPRAAAEAPAPVEEAVPEPAAFPEEAPRAAAAATALASAPPPRPLPPAPRAGFRVAIRDVRHAPEVPERGSEVTTTARVDNQGAQPERVRLVLVVNGKVRDEVTTELAAGEGAEAEFHWVAYLARNEVKVVAERA